MRPYNLMNKEVVIGMPPGIGDLHWIMTKLESFMKINGIGKIKARMNLGYDDKKSIHDCSIEYIDLIPFVDSAESVDEELPFEYALAGGSGTPLFKDYGGCDYLIEFNSMLENHVKLRDILPEYDMDFDYPIDEPLESKTFAEQVKSDMGGKLYLLFAAGLDGNNIWARDLWVPADWMEVARKIYDNTGHKPVLIGAKWDATYADKLVKLDKEKIIHSIVGKTSVAHLFALLREADVLVAYQCGVMMMATKFRTPVACFWPIKSKRNPQGTFNRGFMRTWLPPWAEEVGYKPFAFGDKNATPDGVFSAIEEYL